MIRVLGALCVVALLAIGTPAHAQEKTDGKPGFALKPGSARILLMRPSISVGEQSTGGMFEANADWTAQARDHLGAVLAETQAALGNEVVPYDEGLGGDRGLAVQYTQLFGSLASSVQEYQFFPGNRLPTKKRKGNFDWSLGSGVARIAELQNADYALFIVTHDAYGSTGRKMLQAMGMLGAMFGAPVGVSSGEHKGYAGLIDIKTGELVWLNADHAMGGDVRTREGAVKRVGQLLEGFPGRTGSPAVAK